jgi:hypothetical protein
MITAIKHLSPTLMPMRRTTRSISLLILVSKSALLSIISTYGWSRHASIARLSRSRASSRPSNLKVRIININISRVQRGLVGTAVRQAGVQSSSRHPREIFPSERRSNKENGERPRRMKTDDCIV